MLKKSTRVYELIYLKHQQVLVYSLTCTYNVTCIMVKKHTWTIQSSRLSNLIMNQLH